MIIKVNANCVCCRMHFLSFDLSKGPVFLPKCKTCGSQLTISMIFREEDTSLFDFAPPFLTPEKNSYILSSLTKEELKQLMEKTGLNEIMVSYLHLNLGCPLIARYLLDGSISTKPEFQEKNIPAEEIAKVKKILVDAGMKKRFINTLDDCTLWVLANILEGYIRRVAAWRIDVLQKRPGPHARPAQ